MSDFKCPVCGSPYFGPIFENEQHVGRYCKGWPSGYDRSYKPCRGKHEERFAEARATRAAQAVPAPDMDILASYSRTDGRREWVNVSTWLRPGEVIAHMDAAALAPRQKGDGE